MKVTLRHLLSLQVLVLGLLLVAPCHGHAAATSEASSIQVDMDNMTTTTMNNGKEGAKLGDTKKTHLFGSPEAEERPFAAEVTKMMDIIINSLYKSKEIFLRELIANASDGLDKLRSLGLTRPELMDNWTLDIKIKSDPTQRILVVQDSGIGMTRDELTTNLGTIAKSGTKEFIERFKATGDSNQIGQFGVGFYSSFLAGNVVQVISKTFDGPKHLWECDIRRGTFSVLECPPELDAQDPITVQGTKVIIHLNPVDDDTAADYTSEATLKDLVHRYSEFINFPIYLQTRRQVSEEVPLTDSELEAQKAEAEAAKKEDDVVQVEDADESKATKDGAEEDVKRTKTVTREETEFLLVNNNKPIWTRAPSQVSHEEYVAFYKDFTGDSKEPHNYSHFTVSGSTTDFRGLIYIPRTPSFQLLSNDQPVDFLKLFVKRVFISSDFSDFPRYLSFIKALVDADDIPLNVSRETLQKTKIVRDIKNSVISKTIALLNKMAKNDTAYLEFYTTYANHLKLGVISETEEARKKDLAGLLRFSSSAMVGKNVTSFDDYISRMKPNQTDIYFVSGSDVTSLKKLPYVEALLKRGLEILFMVDTYDEYTVQALPSYKEKTLKNVAKGGISFADETEDEKSLAEQLATRFKPLTDYLGKMFSKKIEKVVISKLLDKSPMAIVANSFGWSPAMEKLMASNSGGESAPMAAFFGKQKKIIEINPTHPLMEGLLAKLVDQPEPSKELDSDVKLLYDAALLHSGYELKNPASFAHRVEDMIRAKYGVEPLSEEAKAAAEEVEPEEPANPMDMFGSMGGAGAGMDGMPDFGNFDFGNMSEDADATEGEQQQQEQEQQTFAQNSTSEKEPSEKDEL